MKVLALLLLALPAFAQGFFTTFFIVDRWCGAVRRGPTRVQVYCYDPNLGTANMWNSIATFTPVPLGVQDYEVIVAPPVLPFKLDWVFSVSGTALNYSLLVNDALPPITGTLTVVYGAVATVGTLVGGKCGAPTGFHWDGTSMMSNEKQANCILGK